MPFVGPLGWSYPLLNLFLDLVEGIKSRKGSAPIQERFLKPSGAIVSNIENVTWTDWRGRERKMSIHREVK